MGRKKKYNTPYERLKAHRNRQRKQIKPKLSKQELIEKVTKEREDWIKQATSDPITQKIISSQPENYKRDFKEWIGWMHCAKRFEYERTKNDFLLWLLQKKEIWNIHFFTAYSEEDQDRLEQEYNELPEEYREKIKEWLRTGNKPIGFSI